MDHQNIHHRVAVSKNEKGMNLGEQIRFLRIARKKTQRELAHLMDTNAVYLCEIEKGRATPSMSFLMRLTDELKADIKIVPR